MEIHLEHLGKVLEAILRHCLFAIASKYSIMKIEVKFFAQWIMPQEATLLKQKIKAIISGKPPKI